MKDNQISVFIFACVVMALYATFTWYMNNTDRVIMCSPGERIIEWRGEWSAQTYEGRWWWTTARGSQKEMMKLCLGEE